MAEDDHRRAPGPDLSAEVRDGLAALAAQGARPIQRHSRLYVRTQERARDLVDQVAEDTGTSIVEVLEYAIFSTYGTSK